MKKCFVFFTLATFFSISLIAQTYKNAIGIRLGASSPAISNGATLKHFISDKNAIEAIVSINNGVGLCALYQWYKPIASVENLQWFLGAGAYAASKYKIANVGIAGMVGVDYKFAAIPLNISLDWKPEINIFNTVGFEASGIGFSARFTF